MTDWIEQQVAQLHALAGKKVTGWSAIEMAFRDEGEDGKPVFEEPTAPFLQLGVVHLTMADGSIVSVQTYEDSGEWGLCPDVPTEPLKPALEGIYRTRRLEGLVTGEVSDVDTTLTQQGNIRTVELRFEGDRSIVLVAGEVYEDEDGSLRYCIDDESVLLFQSVADVESVNWWRPPSRS